MTQTRKTTTPGPKAVRSRATAKVTRVAAAVVSPAHPALAVGTAAEALRLRAATERFTARRERDRLPHRIETARLVLRAPIRGDVPAMVTLADNRNIADKLARLPSPYTRADGIGFVEIFAQRADERPYAITLAGAFIGVVGLTFFADRPPELGYWLGEPFWGKGYMSEAVRGLVEATIETGAFTMLGARALADNTASLNVLHKAGFRPAGEAIEHHEKHGERKLILLQRELRK